MNISRLQYISQETDEKSHEELVEEACLAGVSWVQLRMKNKSYEEALRIAKAVKAICALYKATFIINDYVAIVKEIGADGVHLGKLDMDPVSARQILGDSCIIGGTANTLEDIQTLHQAKVNYIGFGPLRFTSTKENLSPVLGMKGYASVLRECRAAALDLPIIAIGGVVQEDLKELMETGLHGVAISSFINKAPYKKQVVEALHAGLDQYATSTIHG